MKEKADYPDNNNKIDHFLAFRRKAKTSKNPFGVELYACHGFCPKAQKIKLYGTQDSDISSLSFSCTFHWFVACFVPIFSF